MARYTDSVCRLCRRENLKLFLKGERCYGAKCAMNRRPNPPGQHGQARQRKISEYGLQLREKQKARRSYGLTEKQFARTFDRAARVKGVTGENLLILLERRLDNVIYRLGFAESRPQARQMVNHGHIRINGKKVDIPSYTVKMNEEITIKERSRDMAHLKALRESGAGKPLPKWLSLNADALTGSIIAMPQRDDVDLALEEHLIVELYSR